MSASTLFVIESSLADAKEFIAAHYLRKRPAICTCCLLVYMPTPKGIIIFAMPPRQTCVRYGGLTWELARLFLLNDAPPNTESRAIAAAVAYIRRHYRDVRYLVSYADPSAGHKGTVYKAAGWLADGRTDDERKTPRFDYEANGKRYSRRAHVPFGASIKRVPRVSKFRFYLPL